MYLFPTPLLLEWNKAALSQIPVGCQEKFFIEKVVSHKKRLPREVITASSRKSIWMKLSVILLSFRHFWEELGVGIDDLYESPPSWDILQFWAVAEQAGVINRARRSFWICRVLLQRNLRGENIHNPYSSCVLGLPPKASQFIRKGKYL